MIQPSLFGDGLESGAVISDCGIYRYKLWRTWDPGLPPVNWIMLNPSVADHMIDDPTIRRCIGYAIAWGHGGIVVTNLFALRSTDPAALKAAADPVGPDNDDQIRAAARESTLVVCGWGSHGSIAGRSAAVRRLLAGSGITPRCLATTRGGEPGHPLYLRAGLVPVPMDARVGDRKTS